MVIARHALTQNTSALSKHEDPFVDLPHMVNFFYVFLLICDIYALHLINIFKSEMLSVCS